MGMTPQTVNAYYSPSTNEIFFPAAKFCATGAVRNVPQFYTAFDVKPTDALYLPDEERVNIGNRLSELPSHILRDEIGSVATALNIVLVSLHPERDAKDCFD
jgi:hypothetical protein